MLSKLCKYSKDIDWHIILSKNPNGTFNVTLRPKPLADDEALKQFKPMLIPNLTPEQLDEITSETLDNTLSAIQKTVSNVMDYEKHVKEVAEKTKAAKEKKEEKKKQKEEAKKAQSSIFDVTKAPEPEPVQECVDESCETEIELDL